jgi:hypothetical protein
LPNRATSYYAARMADNLKVGDRVRIRDSVRAFTIAELNPPGCTPFPPATFTVRMTPEDGQGPEHLYGNAVLTKVG